MRSKKQLNKKSRLLALNPFIDDDNIMRAEHKTQLKYVEYLLHDARFPLILRSGMWVTMVMLLEPITFQPMHYNFLVDVGEEGDMASRKIVQYMENTQSQSS